MGLAVALTFALSDRRGVKTSSVKLFHFPHPGHLPNHLRDSYPQSLQMNLEVFFAIVLPHEIVINAAFTSEDGQEHGIFCCLTTILPFSASTRILSPG